MAKRGHQHRRVKLWHIHITGYNTTLKVNEPQPGVAQLVGESSSIPKGCGFKSESDT